MAIDKIYQNQENSICIFWFRRDLRIHDNIGFYNALKNENNVLPLFIFDEHILQQFPNPNDPRLTFIYENISALDNEFKKLGSSILIEKGKPLDIFINIIEKYQVKAIYTNEDYEQYGINRDNEIEKFAISKGIKFNKYTDHLIFHPSKVLKNDGSPYTIYTPYSKKWKELFYKEKIKILNTKPLLNNLFKFNNSILTLKDIGYNTVNIRFPHNELDFEKIKTYHLYRDIPSIDGTSKISLHLRFGTISIRECFINAIKLNEKWMNELIWREFYMMILYHFPYIENKSFKKQYEKIEWINNEKEFELWKCGNTGYPIVDAGMRELNSTGFMHNRLRMITASFLTKHLLIDWRWGESYFAEKLLDYELSSNNGGWQWAASTGCDAVPYFRIFNPQLQQEKFDSEFKYIKQWVEEYGSSTYPKPIVEHNLARQRCLNAYKKATSE